MVSKWTYGIKYDNYNACKMYRMRNNKNILENYHHLHTDIRLLSMYICLC